VPPQVAQTVVPRKHSQGPTEAVSLCLKPNVFAICAGLLVLELTVCATCAVWLVCGQSSEASVLCNLRWSYLLLPAVPCPLNLKPNVCAMCVALLVLELTVCAICVVSCVCGPIVCAICVVCQPTVCAI